MGKLYVVATPIGNLEDITYRAVRILGEADLIACEDTRHTRKLLDRYGIATAMVSYHEHNERERATDLVARIRAGQTVALVSDSGTPLVSDPGYRLVRAAIDAGIEVAPIPGPSAVVATLSASGLPSDSFYFGGFLPSKASQRRKTLTAARAWNCTLIFYEAPHRLAESLADIEAVFGQAPVVIARETTKLHEEFARGSAAELREKVESKGEITLLIGKPEGLAPSGLTLEQAVDELVRAGVPRMEAIKEVARERGVPKRRIYIAIVKESKKS